MPPKRKAVQLSGLVDTDDEDDVMQMDAIEGAIRSDSEAEERPVKKHRGRPRSSGQGAPETKKAAVNPRAAAVRGRPRVNKAPPEPQPEDPIESEIETGNDDSLEMDPRRDVSNDELDSPKNVAPGKKTGRPAGTRGRKKAVPEKQVSKDGEFEYTPKNSKALKATDRAGHGAKRTAGTRQRPETDENEVAMESQAPEIDETTLSPENSILQSRQFSPSKFHNAGKTGQRALQKSQSRWNAGRMAEAEKIVGDPELKRRLSDMTKRYESLESRFRTLRDIGIVEANENMEKLKKQCETTTEASSKLVASLKEELAAQKAISQQTRTIQKKLKDREMQVGDLEARVDELTSELSSAHNEIKMLQTKLTAARNTVANVESITSKAPGSAVKNTPANRSMMAANAEAVQAAQIAQLKEDLYSDLTGLIIRDVKKRETDDMYDCIQTGANGTLRFKLAVAHEAESKTTSSLESAEFHYMPLLDENHDRDLVEILPDYLTVDITFSRQQAAKFYTRVMDALTKRRAD
ncbi:hypothetical protein DTO166G4_4101 [Paecilomyces variotii]|nr:hypothetical protein DTO166G4_4101 [Paecilomyces variotii]KAJ9229879.1 hypothetical protein DTO166G5_7602 [Paecilomyces variotii]KAJ9263316.1 hypothetical protein DTO195F2_2972 [Paecilomyces variotii]KAJ9299476.1 hypothetical protein DTO217A2_8206 [Paecilomyces variotii]KAJ9369144.1 hypothetical protein DTO282E5_6213 [Paecilomyces variotii]